MAANKKNSSRLNENINTISQLPEKFKLYQPLYANIGAGAFIPRELRGNMFAIIDEDESKASVVYLLTRGDKDRKIQDELKKRVQTIVQAYDRDTAHPLSLKIGNIGSDEMRDTIAKESETKDTAVVVSNEEADRERRKAEKILQDAMDMGSSDLHIESDGHRATIRVRVHKDLHDIRTMTHDEAKALANMFYSTFVAALETGQKRGSGTGDFKHTNLLDGEFSRIFGDYFIKARMVNIGQNYDDAFTMVLRLIDQSKKPESRAYSKMGFSPVACEMFKRLNTASRGMVLVVGVTGSGKSTSMQNMVLHERDRTGNSRKIYLLEQPIELTMDGVIQINATDSHDSKDKDSTPSDRDFSFKNLNRMLMRGDPDSIGYGEIRDETTANAAVKGVESGHLVYGTMHVSEAIGAFSRFETFNVDLEKLCRKSFIQMILFQHLIPKICPHCSTPYRQGGEIPHEFGESYAVKTFRTQDDRPIDPSKVLAIRKEINQGDSLIRALQNRRVISSRDALEMRKKIAMMNTGNDTQAFQYRLDNLMRNSGYNDDDLNVRFKGDGCKHCFNGTIGVAPAAEILVPDETFLDLIKNRRANQAETYWKSRLGGRSATADTIDKILNGLVDPRSVESELDLLGN